MAIVNTVLGPVSINQLGVTYIHEHLYVIPDELQRYYAYTLDIPEKSIEETKYFQQAGGNTIVDLTPLAYGRNVEALREISLKAGINVVCVTGFHKDLWLPRWFNELSESEIETELCHEIEEGIGYYKVKPGAAKLGTSLNEVTSRERRSFAMVVPLMRDYKIPIITHCDKGTMGHEQLDLFEKYGFSLEHVCLSHTDLTMDFEYMRTLCERGAFLSIDHIGRDLANRDQKHVELIAKLIQAGCSDRLCLSGDMGKKDYFVSYGGKPGLAYILSDLRDYLLKYISEEEYFKMLVDNPRRIFDWN
ncbi:phosphotriesterase [uncultured Olegusella sp.]|uniref:phosphotriesterase family protein n=1 Tax=uncultured Olegusella sp. TaxID=1979846 RepID=UPI002627070D|nr:TatD family hydrolase [uncultured Olegusella sp.]